MNRPSRVVTVSAAYGAGGSVVAPLLAERLGRPHATIIMEVQVAAEGAPALRVKRELEGGWFQWVLQVAHNE